MATNAEIQKFVQRHHGFIPKMGWIAHVKEVHGIATLGGADRARHDRGVEPCHPKSVRPSRRGGAFYERKAIEMLTISTQETGFAPGSRNIWMFLKPGAK
jgi:hypothetical protein